MIRNLGGLGQGDRVLDHGVLGDVGIEHGLAPGVVIAGTSDFNGQLVARNSELRQGSVGGLGLVPARSSAGVLDPGNKPVIHVISQRLLRLCNVGQFRETLIASVEEWHFASVRCADSWDANDVVVVTEPTVHPGRLLVRTDVDQVVSGTEESSVSVRGTAHEGHRFIVRGVVGGQELVIRHVSHVGIEGVNPLGEIGVLTGVNHTEELALLVGVADNQGKRLGVVASSEARLVVREAGDVVHDRREPGVGGRIEVGRLDRVHIHFTKTIQGRVAGVTAECHTSGFNVPSHLSQGDAGRGDGGSRLGIGGHFDRTRQECLGMIPQVMINLHCDQISHRDNLPRRMAIGTEGFVNYLHEQRRRSDHLKQCGSYRHQILQ